MSANKLERDLHQARQSGELPPAVDSKTGQMINPHNPDFLTKRPWYLTGDDAEPSLQHQERVDKDRLELSLTAAEHVLAQQRQKLAKQAAAGKFVKGQWVEALLKNKLPYRICQILKVHKKGTEFDLQYEDGTIERRVKLNPRAERPRVRMTKSGSRSGTVDQVVYGIETYDSKRDQYHGYDHDTHNVKLTKKFEERETLRRKVREEKQQSGDQEDEKEDKRDAAGSDSDFDDSDVGSDDSDDEFVQRDEDAKVVTTRLARQGGVGGAQMKTTARNLRIREDTAKYLRNLDPNSAYYDPKSRSMRDNPNPEIPTEASEFIGDNFARISGDAVGLADTQLFAWEASDKGVTEIHPQANPSQAELLKKQFKSKAEDLKLEQKRAVLNKYGGQEYLDGSDGLASAAAKTGTGVSKPPPQQDRKLRFGVSTKAEEYGQDGRLLTSSGSGTNRKAIPSKYEEDVFLNGHNCVWGSYFHIGAFCWGYADDHSLIKNSYCTGENGRIANDEANLMRYGTGKAGSAALAQARSMLKAMPGQTEKEETSPNDRKRKHYSLKAECSEEDMEAYRLSRARNEDPMAKLGSEEL